MVIAVTIYVYISIADLRSYVRHCSYIRIRTRVYEWLTVRWCDTLCYNTACDYAVKDVMWYRAPADYIIYSYV